MSETPSTVFIFPKSEIQMDEFYKAIKGEPFKQESWFYKENGLQIKRAKGFQRYWKGLDDNTEFIIIERAKMPDNSNEILLDTSNNTRINIGFIFYDCEISSIRLKKSSFSDCYFINTNLAGIVLEDNSRLGSIFILGKSNVGGVFVKEESESGNIWVMDSSKCQTIAILDQSKVNDITVQNDSECGGIELWDSECKNIHISSNSQNKRIGLKNSKCSNISISLNSTNGNIVFDGFCQNGDIVASNGSKIGGIMISNKASCGFISLYENSLCEDISLNNLSRCRCIEVSMGSKCGIIVIQQNSESGYIKVSASKVDEIRMTNDYSGIILSNANVPLILAESCHLNIVKWQAGSKAEVYIHNSFINGLNLTNSALTKESTLSIINSQIYLVKIQEVVVQGQIIMRNIQPMESTYPFTISNHQRTENAGNVVQVGEIERYEAMKKTKEFDFNNLLKDIVEHHKKPSFLLVNSSLGKSELTGSDLRLFSIEYRDSRLLEMFVSGTKLPDINIYNIQSRSNKEYFEQKISIYNQLKRIFDIQGDIVESTAYHSRVMDYQLKLLQLTYKDRKPKWYSLKTRFSMERLDLLNFKLNKWSNNHGESWGKALRFLVITSIIVYTAYFVSINCHRNFSPTGFGEFIGNYFLFLDITHKSDFMVVDKSQVNALAKGLDFFGKVVVGYGIYQFIAAFRRHGRKIG